MSFSNSKGLVIEPTVPQPTGEAGSGANNRSGPSGSKSGSIDEDQIHPLGSSASVVRSFSSGIKQGLDHKSKGIAIEHDGSANSFRGLPTGGGRKSTRFQQNGSANGNPTESLYNRSGGSGNKSTKFDRSMIRHERNQRIQQRSIKMGGESGGKSFTGKSLRMQGYINSAQSLHITRTGNEEEVDYVPLEEHLEVKERVETLEKICCVLMSQCTRLLNAEANRESKRHVSSLKTGTDQRGALRAMIGTHTTSGAKSPLGGPLGGVRSLNGSPVLGGPYPTPDLTGGYGGNCGFRRVLEATGSLRSSSGPRFTARSAPGPWLGGEIFETFETNKSERNKSESKNEYGNKSIWVNYNDYYNYKNVLNPLSKGTAAIPDGSPVVVQSNIRGVAPSVYRPKGVSPGGLLSPPVSPQYYLTGSPRGLLSPPVSPLYQHGGVEGVIGNLIEQNFARHLTERNNAHEPASNVPITDEKGGFNDMIVGSPLHMEEPPPRLRPAQAPHQHVGNQIMKNMRNSPQWYPAYPEMSVMQQHHGKMNVRKKDLEGMSPGTIETTKPQNLLQAGFQPTQPGGMQQQAGFPGGMQQPGMQAMQGQQGVVQQNPKGFVQNQTGAIHQAPLPTGMSSAQVATMTPAQIAQVAAIHATVGAGAFNQSGQQQGKSESLGGSPPGSPQAPGALQAGNGLQQSPNAAQQQQQTNAVTMRMAPGVAGQQLGRSESPRGTPSVSPVDSPRAGNAVQQNQQNAAQQQTMTMAPGVAGQQLGKCDSAQGSPETTSALTMTLAPKPAFDTQKTLAGILTADVPDLGAFAAAISTESPGEKSVGLETVKLGKSAVDKSKSGKSELLGKSAPKRKKKKKKKDGDSLSYSASSGDGSRRTSCRTSPGASKLVSNQSPGTIALGVKTAAKTAAMLDSLPSFITEGGAGKSMRQGSVGNGNSKGGGSKSMPGSMSKLKSPQGSPKGSSKVVSRVGIRTQTTTGTYHHGGMSHATSHGGMMSRVIHPSMTPSMVTANRMAQSRMAQGRGPPSVGHHGPSSHGPTSMAFGRIVPSPGGFGPVHSPVGYGGSPRAMMGGMGRIMGGPTTVGAGSVIMGGYSGPPGGMMGSVVPGGVVPGSAMLFNDQLAALRAEASKFSDEGRGMVAALPSISDEAADTDNPNMSMAYQQQVQMQQAQMAEFYKSMVMQQAALSQGVPSQSSGTPSGQITSITSRLTDAQTGPTAATTGSWPIRPSNAGGSMIVRGKASTTHNLVGGDPLGESYNLGEEEGESLPRLTQMFEDLKQEQMRQQLTPISRIVGGSVMVQPGYSGGYGYASGATMGVVAANAMSSFGGDLTNVSTNGNNMSKAPISRFPGVAAFPGGAALPTGVPIPKDRLRKEQQQLAKSMIAKGSALATSESTPAFGVPEVQSRNAIWYQNQLRQQQAVKSMPGHMLQKQNCVSNMIGTYPAGVRRGQSMYTSMRIKGGAAGSRVSFQSLAGGQTSLAAERKSAFRSKSADQGQLQNRTVNFDPATALAVSGGSVPVAMNGLGISGMGQQRMQQQILQQQQTLMQQQQQISAIMAVVGGTMPTMGMPGRNPMGRTGMMLSSPFDMQGMLLGGMPGMQQMGGGITFGTNPVLQGMKGMSALQGMHGMLATPAARAPQAAKALQEAGEQSPVQNQPAIQNQAQAGQQSPIENQPGTVGDESTSPPGEIISLTEQNPANQLQQGQANAQPQSNQQENTTLGGDHHPTFADTNSEYQYNPYNDIGNLNGFGMPGMTLPGFNSNFAVDGKAQINQINQTYNINMHGHTMPGYKNMGTTPDSSYTRNPLYPNLSGDHYNPYNDPYGDVFMHNQMGYDPYVRNPYADLRFYSDEQLSKALANFEKSIFTNFENTLNDTCQNLHQLLRAECLAEVRNNLVPVFESFEELKIWCESSFLRHGNDPILLRLIELMGKVVYNSRKIDYLMRRGSNTALNSRTGTYTAGFSEGNEKSKGKGPRQNRHHQVLGVLQSPIFPHLNLMNADLQSKEFPKDASVVREGKYMKQQMQHNMGNDVKKMKKEYYKKDGSKNFIKRNIKLVGEFDKDGENTYDHLELPKELKGPVKDNLIKLKHEDQIEDRIESTNATKFNFNSKFKKASSVVVVEGRTFDSFADSSADSSAAEVKKPKGLGLMDQLMAVGTNLKNPIGAVKPPTTFPPHTPGNSTVGGIVKSAGGAFVGSATATVAIAGGANAGEVLRPSKGPDSSSPLKKQDASNGRGSSEGGNLLFEFKDAKNKKSHDLGGSLQMSGMSALDSYHNSSMSVPNISSVPNASVPKASNSGVQKDYDIKDYPGG